MLATWGAQAASARRAAVPRFEQAGFSMARGGRSANVLTSRDLPLAECVNVFSREAETPTERSRSSGPPAPFGNHTGSSCSPGTCNLGSAVTSMTWTGRCSRSTRPVMGAGFRHVVDGLLQLPDTPRRNRGSPRCADAARRIVAERYSRRRLAECHGIGEHGIEDILEVEGRDAHRLEHLGDGVRARPPRASPPFNGVPRRTATRSVLKDRKIVAISSFTEWVDAVAPRPDDSDDVAVDDDLAARGWSGSRTGAALSPAVLGVGQHVVDVHFGPRSRAHAAHARFGTSRNRVLALVAADIGPSPAVRHRQVRNRSRSRR